jgi:carbamoyltransferase
MAGGVALNCVANGKLLSQGPFDDLWIQPAAGDAGGAVGAAYAAWYIWEGRDRLSPVDAKDRTEGAYLGPEFIDADVRRLCTKFQASCIHYEDLDALCKDVADLLAKGQVVGWFQGRMEWGPRALGNRSILADPRDTEMQKRLNLKIKYREGFRPFAPSVLAECAGDYFVLDRPSPYMLLVAPVQEWRRRPLPDGYENMELYDRLYHPRSDIPAVTHIDYSARIQTVHRETNERFWRLINAFKERTGYGLLVNTSFNVRGEPIVCTPEDGYRCFMRTEMDFLVIGDHLFEKSEQPKWRKEDDWRREYELD